MLVQNLRRRALLALACAAALLPALAQEEPTPAEAAAKVDGPVVVGKIDGEIGFAESAYVVRLIKAAETQSAAAVMIELNTFGGRVDAAVAIRDALLGAKMHTAVFINRRAISAGVLISLACKSIAIAPGGTIGAATPVMSAPGQEVAQPVEEKYLSYFREEMRSTAETNGRNGDLAEAMVDADKEVEGVSEKGKLLTLNTQSALEHKIADVEAETVEEALGKIGFGGPIVTLERSWSESLVGFLTSAPVASILFLAMMVLAYMEYQTPGFGVFGFGAICCFLILYFGHYMVNLAGWEELLLFALGVALILVEVFAFPGFGVVGALGILSVLASLVMLLMAGDWSDFTFSNPFTGEAVTQVAATALAGLLAVVLLIRWLPHSRSGVLGGKLVLDGGLASAAGYASHEAAGDDLVGRTGEVVSPLRPAGKARIDGQRLNVETEGDFIAVGETVRVLRREEGRIVVRRV
ncbi:MAG TPA: NfeD family protein [Thermoanaerobaculia bacterium]